MIHALALLAATAGAGAAENSEQVEWQSKHDLVADLDGDGRSDHLRFGLTSAELVVALQVEGGTRTELRFDRREIGCNPVDFSEGCDMPRPESSAWVIDEKEIRSYADVFEVPAAIFVATGKAELVSLPIGETDPIWFFWNAQQRRLDWLRM